MWHEQGGAVGWDGVGGGRRMRVGETKEEDAVGAGARKGGAVRRPEAEGKGREGSRERCRDWPLAKVEVSRRRDAGNGYGGGSGRDIFD